jgi:hypothetical protein
MAAPSAVTPVRSALAGETVTVQVGGSRTSLSRPAEDLNVIYEVRFGHPYYNSAIRGYFLRLGRINDSAILDDTA